MPFLAKQQADRPAFKVFLLAGDHSRTCNHHFGAVYLSGLGRPKSLHPLFFSSSRAPFLISEGMACDTKLVALP